MKRITALLLIAVLLLSGCGWMGERFREPVTFYYLKKDISAVAPGEDIFAGELREASGHRQDLSYLMALYLIGPSGEELRTPIPRGTRISSARYEDQTVYLNMSDTSKTMTDIEFSLACTCLSLTCLELTDAQSVTITSGERSVTMGRNTILLKDEIKTTEDSQ